jgi:carbon storage regulator CsrA
MAVRFIFRLLGRSLPGDQAGVHYDSRHTDNASRERGFARGDPIGTTIRMDWRACEPARQRLEFFRSCAASLGGNDAMLFLTRKVGESIVINDDIEVTVVEVRGKSIKLGFTFPPEAKVLRRELHDRIKAEAAASPVPDPEPTS